MSTNKLIQELSVEELLALAKGAKPEDIIEKISEAAKFIYALNIQDGREKISALLVYHTYKQWKGWDNKRQSKRYFFRDFNEYFKPQRTRDGLVYFLDPKSFDTSKENYWLMRADMRHDKKRRKKT
jgi:hypothetical protein